LREPLPETVELLSPGLAPVRQIARDLGISESTVRNHLSQIFKKTHASNRIQAVAAMLRVGLLIVRGYVR